MTSFIVSIIISIVIVTGSVFHTNHVIEVSESLVTEAEEISEHLYNDSFDEAEAEIERLEKKLNKHRSLLASMGNHEELVKIEITCEELKVFTSQKSKTDALVQCASLKAMLNNMPKNYRLKPENIL